MNKYDKLTYKQKVERAKEFLVDVNAAKYEICLLAVSVCDIRHGGKTKEEVYTLSKFANDIGMVPKRLSVWVVEHKRVYSKLGIQPKKGDSTLIREVMKRVGEDASKKEVADMYAILNKYSKEDFKLLQTIKYGVAIKNFTQDYDLKLFNKEDVFTLKTLLETALGAINE